MLALAAFIAASSLTPSDWLADRATLFGACEAYVAVDRPAADALFERQLNAYAKAGLSEASKEILRSARDNGRTLKLTGEQCNAIATKLHRPSYMTKYGFAFEGDEK